MRVEVTVADATVEGARGVTATCGECDAVVECRGRSQRSVRRCLALLRERCAEADDNFYVDPDIESRDP